MNKEAPLSIAERDFILNALREDVRLDGRAADELRPLKVTFGEEYGHVKVQLGRTSLVTRISAEVTKPHDDRPFDGLFTIAMELTAMGSPAWDNGRQGDLETYVTNVLDRVIRHSNALDTESLCIVKGVSCWSIRADVHITAYDGNLIDAACAGIMAGLQHFRRPDAVVKDGQVIVYGLDERVPVALNITHKPLAVTFHSFDEGKRVVLDATRREEQAAEADVVFGLNNAGDVCFMSKFSGSPVDAMVFVNKTSVALDKVKEINAVIDKALQADLAKRAKTGMAEESRAENDR
ncbi:ribosomal protein S5 domain 2-like protein [Aspergillus japonicus CBS 114.51]|uniref:Exosome complex component RRP45 n=2 Tax=Aspergillus subgen. Circumdati TaxID=2720871 RepID=A0A2V5JD16_9EURO|nr:ribosomal protein S5 domain 2-like protein [Aspergillus japonicus CBS 114.51]PYI36987.1 ribosomal protein S5 domain 2-like protein [Aspergillus indologenus CBS 114.80]RAH86549.1 ribosomal protein S5 domain 2-like protein [Aspergillus japonicus CBS 114.51]